MNRTSTEEAIIFAPRGRDGAVACAMLREAGLGARAVPDLPALVTGLRGGAGFAILTEEALRGADLRGLVDFLKDQAEWSDFPFILLTERGGGPERNPGAVRFLDTLGNVTFLERPFHPTTLISLARSARRARLRQYEARARLDDIRAGREGLELALAAGGLGAWTLDVATVTLTADNQCKAHFGRGADDAFSYDELLTCIHDDDREDMQRAVRHSLDTGADYDVEYRCCWPDGSIHWVQINGRVEHDPVGAVTRVVGVSHEITERRRVEARQAALLALGDGLRQMTDAADMSILAARILGETLGVDRAGYGVIDPLRETITIDRDWNRPGVKSLAGILSFRDYGSYIEDLKRGDTVTIADARQDPRTRKRAAALEAISARAVLNMPIVDNGDFVALLFLNHGQVHDWPADDLAFVRDVAYRTQAAIERHHAEQSLADLAATLERQVEERTRERDRTWQNSQDLLAVVAEDGRFIAANPAWTTILGWQPNEVVGRDHLAFSHPDDQALSDDAYHRVQNGDLRQYENRVRHKDGSYRWVSWVASFGEGRVYASGRHISAEKEAQLQLEGAQEQLRQAQKMEAVGQLTGGIAHDFNNLLTAISGSLELMQVRVAQGRSAEIPRYVDAAQQAARRAASLTHRLLAFSRRQTLDPRPISINRLLIGMDDLLRRSVGPTIEVEIVGAGGLWTTLLDPNQLENALLNLCINARDAMAGEGRITIETANKWLDRKSAQDRDLPPGQYVTLCVTDTGSGMDAETIERAFDPFFTTKPLGEGTGLGLSMIYGFVRQSGGQVRIYSEVGQGTTMCLYFPRAHGADAGDETEVAGMAPRSAESGETVLVVDDEAAVRMLVTDVLAEHGYHALEASDGPAGLAILESSARIDLLITDVGLPKGMNGRQLADAARIRRPDLKILFITGYAENAVIGNGHLDPGMHILTKPFAMDALSGRIRELIG
ncbi:PAS domain-containing protein [Sphingomonas sp. So64.6b]|uniref:PAS domain-containing protein n=1 Tax=Sphingomonas sp. So64.6b TaxID=2997354 RepID=UPI0018613856|nr:PAS domain-containing protein [Sphingomonas sp. So64.6b]QNA85124.1 PAS domain-containing protein [Sphingomonas sp. So64.6b]